MQIAQEALSSPDLRVETHHLLSFVLALCAAEWDTAVAAGTYAARHRKSGGGGGRTPTVIPTAAMGALLWFRMCAT